MTILSARRKPRQYRCYLVRPVGNFSPKNWQEKPARFQIVEKLEVTNSLGKADAHRFLVNHAAIEARDFSSWFIWLV